MRQVLPAFQYLAIALGDEAPAVAGRLVSIAAVLAVAITLLIRA